MYTYTAAAALCDVPDATLLGIPCLLINQVYRDKVLEYVKDPVLKTFWDDFYATIPDKDRRQQTMSTLNKMYSLITDPTIRNIIGQKRTSFKITNTSIVVASFSPKLGVEKTSFLATLLLYFLPDIFTILDDGFHLGPRAVTEKENIVFSHQYLAQLTPPMRETLIGSADEMIAFRLGPSDAERLEKEFELNRSVSTLTELAPFMYHRKGMRVEHDRYSPPLEFDWHNPQKIINASREKYCSPREHVEQKIRKFIENT
jgi:hypothetical protein